MREVHILEHLLEHHLVDFKQIEDPHNYSAMKAVRDVATLYLSFRILSDNITGFKVTLRVLFIDILVFFYLKTIVMLPCGRLINQHFNRECRQISKVMLFN